MIQQLDAALLKLQAALIARSMYPSGHPRVRASEQEACDLLEPMLRDRGKVTVIAVDERVVFDEQILPASGTLGETLFHLIRRGGAHRVTFHHGLQPSEIEVVLNDLARCEQDETAGLRATPHVTFDLVNEGGESKTTAPSLDVAPGCLEQVFGDLVQHGDLDEELLETIVASVSQAVTDNSGTVLPLAQLKRHDEYTYVHTINVAVLSSALASAMGFESDLVHEVTVSALLHDVGKRLVPPELLRKTSPLTDSELQIMRRHPVDGAELLFGTPGVKDLAPIVAYEHHIGIDGAGYPTVPHGWTLSLASRIVQVADVFDALRTHRPYRSALPLPHVVEIMGEDIGVLFDAELLSFFFERVVRYQVDPAQPAYLPADSLAP